MSNCSPPPRARISSTVRAPAMPLPITISFFLFDSISYLRSSDWLILGGLLDTCRAHFEFRHLRNRVEGRIGEQIHASAAAPMKRREHRVHPDRGAQARDHQSTAAARRNPNGVAVLDSDVL